MTTEKTCDSGTKFSPYSWYLRHRRLTYLIKERAIKIVSQIAEVSHADALAKLLKCHWQIKAAIVSFKLGIDVEKAKEELKRHCGVLRKVIAGPKSEEFRP